MGNHRIENVTEALNGSGLIELMYPQYQTLLRCTAEMADECGSREFSATHNQIAKRSGGSGHETMTPEIVAELVFDFIRLGIVEVVSATGPVSYQREIGKSMWRRKSKDERTTYRFGSYERFVEMADEIRQMQDNDDAPSLPSVVSKSGPMRTIQ